MNNFFDNEHEISAKWISYVVGAGVVTSTVVGTNVVGAGVVGTSSSEKKEKVVNTSTTVFFNVLPHEIGSGSGPVMRQCGFQSQTDWQLLKY